MYAGAFLDDNHGDATAATHTPAVSAGELIGLYSLQFSDVGPLSDALFIFAVLCQRSFPL
jgi:hypothetical protein